MRRRYSVLMLRADALFKRLKAARLDNSVEAEMRRLTQVQLLLIDDFALQALDATETADFYELVVARHHKSSTVLTSNREPSEWLAMMSDACSPSPPSTGSPPPPTNSSSKESPTGADRNRRATAPARRLTPPRREIAMLAETIRWSHPRGK